MFRKISVSVLTIGLINLFCFFCFTSAFAETKEEKEAKLAEKIKVSVIKLGVGKDAKVSLKLKDGKKLKGYIKE
jgi:hypothetical protein